MAPDERFCKACGEQLTGGSDTLRQLPDIFASPHAQEAKQVVSTKSVELSRPNDPLIEPLRSINTRLAAAPSPEEATEWLRVRKEFIDHEEQLQIRAYARSLQKLWLFIQIIFSIATCSIGIWLIFRNLMFPGFFLLGAGLFVIVEDYVKLFLRKFGNDK